MCWWLMCVHGPACCAADLPSHADAHHKNQSAKGSEQEHGSGNGVAQAGDTAHDGAASPVDGKTGGMKAMLSSFVEVRTSACRYTPTTKYGVLARPRCGLVAARVAS